jgi:hypothetical protein
VTNEYNLECSGRYDKHRVSKPESFRISNGEISQKRYTIMKYYSRTNLLNIDIK